MEKIIKYYKDILGIDLNDSQHPISNKINSIESSTETDKKIKEHHLRILGLSLMDIKEYDEDIYDYYIKRIVNNTDISIHGHIFEINQCAHFIRVSKEKELNFKFGEPNLNEPDFIVNECGFEITSSRFANYNAGANPGIKLLRKFREKNGKEYADTNCALIIDINQMSYHTIKNGQPVSPTFEEVRETIRKESKFGLVLFFVEWIEKKDDNFFFKGTVYSDYNESCKPDLKEMIQQKFVTKQEKIEGKLYLSSN
ncbi:MAG: hypothetical protein CMC05_13615 [Flavobacteriaceae bacterium]|nr:hypothetical protein [Flavobacteriaceae bacterium]